MIHKNIENQKRLARLCHQGGRYKYQTFAFARIYFDDWNEESTFRYYNDGNGRRFKSLKKHGNRKIRYYKGDIKNGGHCYKIYSAKWDLH